VSEHENLSTPDEISEPEKATGLNGISDPKEVAGLLGALHDQLRRVEDALGPEARLAQSVEQSVERRVRPAWREATEGEHRLPVAAVVGLAIALQLVLPSRLVIHPTWLLPALEGALVVALIVANPVRINRTSKAIRATSVGLIALISLSNAWSSAELIKGLVNGTAGDNASLLLGRGASVYVTNIIVFALWYWEWHFGGPVSRAQGLRAYPDFLFPQMTQLDLAPPTWRPNFFDYLYVSFTNATAFSPTDTMPLSRWAKLLMLLQSAVALLTVAFVVARAVNILK
jgi:uncharacterized membrane protein